MSEYEPQAGDTTMDEAVGLLREAAEILERDNRPEAEGLRERIEQFIEQYT